MKVFSVAPLENWIREWGGDSACAASDAEVKEAVSRDESWHKVVAVECLYEAQTGSASPDRTRLRSQEQGQWFLRAPPWRLQSAAAATRPRPGGGIAARRGDGGQSTSSTHISSDRSPRSVMLRCITQHSHTGGRQFEKPYLLSELFNFRGGGVRSKWSHLTWTHKVLPPREPGVAAVFAVRYQVRVAAAVTPPGISIIFPSGANKQLETPCVEVEADISHRGHQWLYKLYV